jgi:hypothetical protein
MLTLTLWAREKRNKYSGRWHTVGYGDSVQLLTAIFGRCSRDERNVKFRRVTPVKGRK